MANTANIHEMTAIVDRLNQMLDAVNATGVKFYYSDFDNCMRLQLRKSPNKDWDTYTYYLTFKMIARIYDSKSRYLHIRSIYYVVAEIKNFKNRMMEEASIFVDTGYPCEYIFRQYSEWRFEDVNDTAVKFLELLSDVGSLEELELKLVVTGY
jgi:hypothetical protein